MDDRRFISALDRALDRVVYFYTRKETELYNAMDTLMIDVAKFLENRQHPCTKKAARDIIRQTQDDACLLPCSFISQNTADHDAEAALSRPCPTVEQQLRRQVIDLFVSLSELKSFVSLNATAFAKILRKYAKITGDLKRDYDFSTAYPFRALTKQKLNDRTQRVDRAYTSLTSHGDLSRAVNELKIHLRDRIVWERNTVWRDMIGQEREVQSVGGIKEDTIWMPSGGGGISKHPMIDQVKLTKGAHLLLSLVVFGVLLSAPLFPEIEQNRCFAILVFASILWATEVKKKVHW